MPIVLYVPLYFAIKIIPNGSNENLYVIGFTDFGNSIYFAAFAISSFLLEAILLVISLAVFNFISLFKFRKMMKEKRRLMATSTRHIDKAKIRFTKLILSLTSICIMCRLLDIAVSIFYMTTTLFEIKLSEDLISLIFLSHTISIFMLIVSHSLDGTFYFIYDRQLTRVLRKTVGIQNRDANTNGMEVRYWSSLFV